MKAAIVLPKGEFFEAERAGAVALTVLDYLRCSAHAAATRVLGPAVPRPFDFAGRFVPVQPRGAWWRKDTVAYAAGCAAILAEESPDVIEVHNRVEVLLHLAKAFPHIPACLHLHNDPQSMRGCRTPGERQAVIERAAAVFCVSAFLRERFLEGVQRGAEKVHVLYNAIDPAVLPPRDEQPLLLYVGRVIPEKGVRPFAEAAAAVLQRLPEWRVEVVGAHRPGAVAPDSDYERQVRDILAALGERGAYRSFLPHDEVMRRFARAAIAAVPSVWPEPFGRTALEAMAAGAAVVTSGRGGLREVVGDAALVVDPPEPAGLAAALLRLAGDAAERRALQARGWERVRTCFDVKLLASRWDEMRGVLPGVTP